MEELQNSYNSLKRKKDKLSQRTAGQLVMQTEEGELKAVISEDNCILYMHYLLGIL